MSLAIHLFRKDLRHLRLLVVVWLVVVVLETVFAATDLAYTAESQSVQRTLWWLSGLTSFLSIALAISIVPLFIQDDSTVGTTAFWLNRPFSRWDLLGGKMCFLIAVLVLPPLIAEIVVFVLHRVTARDLLLAVPEIFLTKLTFLIPLLVLAVLTPSLSRYILVGVVTLVAFILIATAVASLMVAGMQEREVVSAPRGRPPAVLGFLLPLILGGAVVAHQYLTRKTVRSVLLLVLGLILFWTPGRLWPRGSAEPHWPQVDGRLFDSDRVGVSLDPQSVTASDSFSFRATDRPKKTIAANLELSGVKPEFVVVPHSIDAILRFPDGAAVRFARPVSAGPYWKLDAVREALNGTRLLYPERYAADYGRGRASWRILEVDARDYDRYREEAGLLSANVRFHVSRYRVASELPLRETARMQKGSDHVLIMRILEYPNGRRLILRERNLKLLLADVRGLSGQRLHALWNRGRGEAILPQEQPSRWGMYFSAVGFGFDPGHSRFERRLELLDFSGENHATQAPVQLDDGWLSGARLTRIEVDDLGYFSKPLRVEGFRMKVPAQQHPNQSAPLR